MLNICTHLPITSYRVPRNTGVSTVDSIKAGKGRTMATEKSIQERQDALLEQAMSQPGVSGLMDAYAALESTYSDAVAATAIEPLIVTTNTAG